MDAPRSAHAVVLGGGMAGLLAARVLAERYQRVTVIDRDPLPATGRHRRGVPQGRHLHGLHPRGLQILDEQFPGFADTLAQAGAVTGEMPGESRFLRSGHRFGLAPAGPPGVLCSQPLLEGHVRARVAAMPQVRFLACAVTGLTSTTDGRQVTGVRVTPDRGEERSLHADLVVDATGRGSRTPLWLVELGYQPADEDRMQIGIGYATRTFRLGPGALACDAMIVSGGPPGNPRTGVLAAVEGGRHLVTLAGVLGDHPPTDLAGFTGFARSLTFPDIADALVGADAMDEGVAFRFPASVRRRYERLPAFPARLLVIGDALSSSNPINGHGMTVAAMQATLLRRHLARHPVPDPRRWFRAVANVVDAPWSPSVPTRPRVLGPWRRRGPAAVTDGLGLRLSRTA